MSSFLSVEDALAQILPAIDEFSAEVVHLGEAAGRVLGADISANFNSPPFDNSAMDGIALRFADLTATKTTLPLIDESAAGDPATHTLQPGTAIRISTGALLPDGADTVIPREFLDLASTQVTIDLASPQAAHMRAPSRGANIRRAGTYLQTGEVALPKGTVLGGAEIGLLASFGHAQVKVSRQPRVAIVSTGSELVELGQAPGEGQIINSNAYMLETLVREAGAIPTRYPIASDSREEIEALFRTAIAQSDFVISSGGVSVGDHDHVKAVLLDLSDQISFWKVKVKPGKPLAFGVAQAGLRKVPLIGLPGNPASSLVGFYLFALPALQKALGRPDHRLPKTRVPLLADVRGARGRRAYLAGTLRPHTDGLAFQPVPRQSSGDPNLFATATAFGIVPEGTPHLSKDTLIDVLLLPR